jgi:hypothetical protein
LADKSQQLVLDALHRAVGENAGLPLFAGRSSNGLFANSVSGKKAAQVCKDQGFVRTLRTQTKGRSCKEFCTITEKGLAFLLEHVPPGEILESLMQAVVQYLETRQTAGALEDCPLPELFRDLRQVYPTLTIGQFQDGLRKLHEHQRIYLHPWTGPLYEIPEPALALLVGHEIAYYASTRR